MNISSAWWNRRRKILSKSSKYATKVASRIRMNRIALEEIKQLGSKEPGVAIALRNLEIAAANFDGAESDMKEYFGRMMENIDGMMAAYSEKDASALKKEKSNYKSNYEIVKDTVKEIKRYSEMYGKNMQALFSTSKNPKIRKLKSKLFDYKARKEFKKLGKWLRKY